ncbi:MAG: YaaA family protein [Romboutsia sp.]|uniref:YaaA family protein n=1 Tax=Romboutsia sp. TaxID=1965302 RepID=UPI003F3151DF
MITIISPTTTMNFNKNINLKKYSEPLFSEDANYIMSILKSLSVDEVSNLMNLSYDLSNLNFNRYYNYSTENNPKCQSILAFDGEVFNCMNVSNFDNNDIVFANNHLKILSGLYGILSPLDLIEPYRLEMKAKLINKNGNNLYKFWKSKITYFIIDELKNHKSKTLINLASSEYVKCIDLKKLKEYNFIDIVFKEYDPIKDIYKVKGLYAKKARGYMVSYIVKNKIDDLDSLKNFNLEGYTYNNKLSTDSSFVFTR